MAGHGPKSHRKRNFGSHWQLIGLPWFADGGACLASVHYAQTGKERYQYPACCTRLHRSASAVIRSSHIFKTPIGIDRSPHTKSPDLAACQIMRIPPYPGSIHCVGLTARQLLVKSDIKAASASCLLDRLFANNHRLRWQGIQPLPLSLISTFFSSSSYSSI